MLVSLRRGITLGEDTGLPIPSQLETVRRPVLQLDAIRVPPFTPGGNITVGGPIT